MGRPRGTSATAGGVSDERHPGWLESGPVLGLSGACQPMGAARGPTGRLLRQVRAHVPGARTANGPYSLRRLGRALPAQGGARLGLLGCGRRGSWGAGGRYNNSVEVEDVGRCGEKQHRHDRPRPPVPVKAARKSRGVGHGVPFWECGSTSCRPKARLPGRLSRGAQGLATPTDTPREPPGVGKPLAEAPAG